jgi:hypothetical protein
VEEIVSGNELEVEVEQSKRKAAKEMALSQNGNQRDI